MLRLDKVIKPWKESAALSDHINLYGFWNETAFLTKSGDLGMVMSISGVDYESLDHSEQEYAVKRLEAALKPEAVHLVSQHVGVAILTKPTALGFSGEDVVVKPLSDTSLCFETCVIMRSDDDSRLANEFVRSFLRRYEPQFLPPKQMELSLSA